MVESSSASAGGGSISARLERLPLSRWHLRTAGIVGVASFFDAYDSLTLAFVLPVLIKTWSMSASEAGVLIAAGYGGQLIGAISLSYLAERIGRVGALRLAIGTLALLSLACALADNYPTLLALRFVQGLGLGAEVPIAATYVNEICATRFRGRMVYLLQVMFAGGVMATSIVALWLVPLFGWRSLFIVGGLPLLLALGLHRLVPESPRWLFSRGRASEAAAAMDAIEGDITRRGRALEAPAPTSVPAAGGPAPALTRLFTNGYGRRTIMLWVIMFCTSFAGYGLVAWMPTIYRSVYKLDLSATLLYSALGGIAGFLAAVTGASIIDVIGRRKTFAIGFVGCAVPLFALAALGPGASLPVLVGLPVTSLFFISLLLAGVYAYAPELYPNDMRALGVGVASTWMRIATIVGPIVVGATLQSFGITIVYILFGVAALVGAAVVLVFLIETRGRSLEALAPSDAGDERLDGLVSAEGRGR